MDTRSKIIQAAVQLFGQKGYYSTSIQEISEHAGVSKGAVFHYFPNKSDLLFVIHDIHINILLEHAAHILEQNELTAAGKLRAMITDLIQVLTDYKLYAIVFFQEFRHITDAEKLAAIKKKRNEYEKAFRVVLRQGLENGEFRPDLNINLAVKGILGMCDWTTQWLKPEGPLTPEQIGQLFGDMLLNGISATK